ALSVQFTSKRLRLGINVTRAFPGAVIRLERKSGVTEWQRDLAPGRPVTMTNRHVEDEICGTTIQVLDRDGEEVIAYTPQPKRDRPIPQPATEPLPPGQITSTDELFITGVHLEQYRHATRCPTTF